MPRDGQREVEFDPYCRDHGYSDFMYAPDGHEGAAPAFAPNGRALVHRHPPTFTPTTTHWNWIAPNPIIIYHTTRRSDMTGAA